MSKVMISDPLSAKNLSRLGLRLGAYNGARKRRFVLFIAKPNGTETRCEFDTAKERDAFALRMIAGEQG